MALYAIGDLHLSLADGKPMDIFNGWHNYVERIQQNWIAKITADDTVVLAGDSSWAMSLEGAKTDFEFINNLPGTKLILKGNHDYWWATMSKMQGFLDLNEFNTMKILHNNCYFIENSCICGSRGWLFDQGQEADQKVIAREALRLQASIDAAGDFKGEKIVFLHYPPLLGDQLSAEIIDVLLQNKIKRCFYGHIHGPSCSFAMNGEYLGIDFRLISADYLKFDPILVDLQ